LCQAIEFTASQFRRFFGQGEDCMNARQSFGLLLSLLLSTAIASLASTTVRAGTIATFTLQNNQTFTFTNKGNTSDLLASGIGVSFMYALPNTYGAVNAPIAAKLTFIAPVSAVATSSGGEVTQPMTLLFLGVLANVPVNGNNNLVTAGPYATAVPGAITGTENGTLSSFEAPTDDTQIGMTSAFFNFDNYKNLGVSINLTNMSDELTIDANGYLNSFTASGSGSIFGTPIVANVPEPSSWVLMLAGLVPVAVLARRLAVRR
jgi:hypothetical protein